MARGPVGAGPKSLQLPVTPPRPEVQSSLSDSRPLADRIAFIDADGQHVSWLNEDEARELVRSGRASFLGTRKKIRCIQAAASGPDQGPPARPGAARRKYSHRRETEENPAGVWTLIRLRNAERPFFVPAELRCPAA